MCSGLSTIVCFVLVFFRLTIVLSIRLQIFTSDYHFVNLNFFLISIIIAKNVF